MQPTIVQLFGGLGNQLFMYSAGIYLREVLDHRVVFDVIEAAPGAKANAHGSSITSLNLDLTHLGVDSRISQSKKQLTNLFEKLPGIAMKRLVFGETYKPTSTGFIGDLSEIPHGARVRGFFQTHYYADRVQDIFPERRELIRNPSSWLANEIVKAEDQKPLMVHVRRGDYIKAPDSWGILGTPYYQSAIDLALVEIGERPIWVFSDDLSLAKSDLVSLQKKEIRFIQPPPGNDPAEDLALMALGEGNVIANSKFSWWAARLNSEARAVIAPEPWFRDSETPRELLPQQWKRTSSEWQ